VSSGFNIIDNMVMVYYKEFCMLKRVIKSIIPTPPHHWVGDGFKVNNFIPSLVSHDQISPFIMLDYGAPTHFEPSENPHGVGSHPHRGFETVTIAYKGRVQHHDSAGNIGVIGTGEVQWMTAGSGILHKEYHEKEWAKEGGEFQMVQLWVNLPAKDKMVKPGYQAITRENIKRVELEKDAGYVEIIAGKFGNVSGPATTYSDVNLWNIYLSPDSKTTIHIPTTHNASLLIIDGQIEIEEKKIDSGNMVIFEKDGNESVEIVSKKGAIVLMMSGEPIDEPIVSYGPFVMNTEEQIIEAVNDFNDGKFGVLE
jgi:quercetin 2,3-dioxygenase